ncbi:hypothetical protein [Achromobacter sp. Root565]|uniref:hypothetical protein n=1 Tax=Achromobacter sp. Root565 TaxID=1736564 RepID=UPI0012E33F62|nr:hypothetical protein [Achromobacter sp. Root565]
MNHVFIAAPSVPRLEILDTAHRATRGEGALPAEDRWPIELSALQGLPCWLAFSGMPLGRVLAPAEPAALAPKEGATEEGLLRTPVIQRADNRYRNKSGRQAGSAKLTAS